MLHLTPTLTVLVADYFGTKDSIKNVQNLCFDFDLVDICI